MGQGILWGGVGAEDVQPVLSAGQAGHCQGKAVKGNAVHLVGESGFFRNGSSQNHSVFLLFHVQTASKVVDCLNDMPAQAKLCQVAQSLDL